MVVTVMSQIEIPDVEDLITTICNEYGYDSVNDMQMDDIYEYICDHTTYILPKRTHRIESVEGYGPNIIGFDDNSYDKIEAILESMQD